MMRYKLRVHFWCGFLVAVCTAPAFSAPTTVLPAQVNGQAKARMLHRVLMTQADKAFAAREKEYEQIDSASDVAAYQKRRRQFLREQIGGLPEPSSLNARVTGAFEHEGLRIEKIVFESRPGFHVTGTLYLPNAAKFDPPYPGVVVASGHTQRSKAYPMYQKATALLARHGIAGLIFDPIGQGERDQLPEPIGGEVEQVHDADRIGPTSHTLPGVGSILMGRNLARIFIWDGMRAVDYLASRETVDADRIGFMGNSGGGTQTAYVYALDEQVKAASPACYITNLEQLLRSRGPQDAEQNIFNSVGFGLNHGDYLLMRAPTPVLVCSATRDAFPIAGTWDSYREAERLFMRLNRPFQMGLVEHDGSHGYKQPLREAAVQWMQRWLRGVDTPVNEKPYEPLSAERLYATPGGDVLALDGARSIYDLHKAHQKKLAKQRHRLWQDGINDKLRQRIRNLAGIKRWNDLPEPEVEREGETRLNAGEATKLVFRLPNEMLLPALYLSPEAGEGDPATATAESKAPVLIVHEEGKQKLVENERIEPLLKEGRSVLALDPRGVGETAPAEGDWHYGAFGPASRQAMVAYLLGESLMGMRAEDLLIAARWLSRHPRSATETASPRPIELRATGHLTVPALHAAVLTPERFSHVRLEDGLRSWASVVTTPRWRDAATNLIHGALTVYDLPRLRDALGKKLTVKGLHDAANREVAR